MASETEICNLAISHLGIGKEIGNLETERSEEAAACRRFYEICRNTTLRDYNWPFATQFLDLALIEEDPTDEWNYSYGYPSDCVKLRRILSGVRNDDRQSRVPYKLVNDGGTRVIFSDQENATAEYTGLIEDPSLYPDDFVMALSLLLASYIAPRLTGGDPFKVGERALKLYEFNISSAKSTAVNEEQPEELPDSEFIQIRD